MIRLLVALLLLAAVAHGQDVVFRKSGDTKTGHVVGIQTLFLQLEVELAADQPKATLSIPLIDVDHVDFGETEPVEDYLAKATRANLLDIEKLWKQRESLLEVPESTAGAFALRMGKLLLESPLPPDHQLALDLFQRIEREDWSERRKSLAKEGRLRAMVQLGRAEEAVDEAGRLALYSEDPKLLIEAKYVLAQASKAKLDALVEENPKWEEDDEVRPIRNELYSETLDLFLFPYLFHGSFSNEAARGLWGAIGVYRDAGETAQATGRARDLVAIFPETTYARQATDYLSEQKAKPDK